MKFDALIEAAIRTSDLDALDSLEKRLFVKSKEQYFPFAPAIELSPETLAAGDPKDADDAYALENFDLRVLAMQLASRISKAKRRILFDKKIARGFDGFIIFSAGDSWFQYPVFLRDVIQHLSDDENKAILSFGANGDLLSAMAARREWAESLPIYNPKIILLSLGGNDLFAEGKFENVLRPYRSDVGAEDLIDMEAYEALLKGVEADYRGLVKELLSAQPELTIFGHAYDLPNLREGGRWIGKPLKSRGIPMAIGRQIAGLVLDDFASMLRRIEEELPNFCFVDVKGAVGKNVSNWNDELHPKSAGFGHVAERFRAAIAARCAPSAAPSGVHRDPRPVSAATYSSIENERDMAGTPAAQAANALVTSSFAERARMAKKILDFEARRDNQGRLAVYYLHPEDGGGRYEVAGINDRYHKEEADHLVALIEAGHHDAAETYAIEMIASYTDPADRWCTSLAVEFYLRDCMFNRGPSGAAWIVQHAVGVEIDRVVGDNTRGAIRSAEADPQHLLKNLRASREC